MAKLQSFEMWAYRKMMKISWRETKTNEEVLTLADKQLYIIPTIKKRKISYFGHMIRQHPQVVIEGSTGVEKKQRKAKNGVDVKRTETTGMRYEDLVRLVQDREPWRIMTANLLKEDGT